MRTDIKALSPASYRDAHHSEEGGGPFLNNVRSRYIYVSSTSSIIVFTRVTFKQYARRDGPISPPHVTLTPRPTPKVTYRTVRRKSETEYSHGQLCKYMQGSIVYIRSPTNRNLAGSRPTVPPPVLSPSTIPPPPSTHRASIPGKKKKKKQSAFQNIISICYLIHTV